MVGSKDVVVELFGPARIHAGLKVVSIIVEVGATWRDPMAALAQASPVLEGRVLAQDRRDLIGSYVLNVGGIYTIHDLDEGATLQENERLALLDAGICQQEEARLPLL